MLERPGAAGRGLAGKPIGGGCDVRIYGLTGNTGTGKTTVARLLERQGIPVVDADRLAREVVEPEQPALAEIVETFGERYLDPSGHLDRRALGRLVFGDREALARLEAIVHPRVLARVAERFEALEQQGETVGILDAAALIESGLGDSFDGLIVVRCDREQQIARIMSRDRLSRQDAEQRIGAQLSTEQKVSAADYVIDNSGSPEELEQEVQALARWIRFRS